MDQPSGKDLFRQWLNAVARINGWVLTSEPLEPLLDLVARTAKELMGYDFCAVLLPDEQRHTLVIRGSHGLSAAYLAGVNADHPIRLRRDGPMAPSSRAFVTQRPAAVVDIPHDPTFVPWSGVAREQGFMSMIAIPLVVSGASIGTLNCYTNETHEFTEVEIDLLGTLSNQAGIAVLTAQLRAAEAAALDDLRTLHRTLEVQLHHLRQSEEVHRRLTTVALTGGGIGGVASALSALLNRSIRIVDLHGDTLGTSVARSEPAPTAPVDDGLQAVVRGFANDSLCEVDGAGPVHVAAPVRLAGEIVAIVTIAGPGEDLDGVDKRAIEHASTVCALELLRKQTAIDVARRAAGEIVTELLGEDPGTRASAAKRALGLGHDLDIDQVMLLVRADDESPPSRVVMRAIERSTAARDVHSLVGVVGNNAVVLYPKDEGTNAQDLADEIRQSIADVPGHSTVSAAVAERCTSIADYGPTYRTLRGAVGLSRLRGGSNQVVAPETLGVPGLLLRTERPADLESFAHRILAPVRAADTGDRSALIDTLRTYLENGSDTAITAKKLYVHPNTVRLRIRRIEELVAGSLADTHVLVQLSAALMAEQVLEVT